MPKPTPSSNTNENEPKIPLSAAAFIAAMKGETVVDENGVEWSFSAKNVVEWLPINDIVIDNVVVSETVYIEEGDEFNFNIELRHNDFKTDFR